MFIGKNNQILLEFQMKILFVGVFSVPWSTNHQMVKAFENKGQKVIKFDYRHIAFKNIKLKVPIYLSLIRKKFDIIISFRIYLPNIIRNLRFYLFGNWKMNRQLLYLIRNQNFDLVFLSKTDTINYKIIPKINKFSKTWYYFMDPIYISNKIRANKYSKLSTFSSASTTANYLKFKKEKANTYYITQGVNLATFKPTKEKKKKEFDVLFIGSRVPKRKKYVDFLLKNNINIVCYGKGWDNEPIYLEELVNKYRKSKIILNFHKEDTGFSIRVFQVIATGSFLLSEYCSDLEKIFKKEIHIDWFKNPEECLKLIKYYLNNGEIREKIAQQAYEFVSENYTWEKIMEKVIQIIEN